MDTSLYCHTTKVETLQGHARCLSYTRCVFGMPDDTVIDGKRVPLAAQYLAKGTVGKVIRAVTVSASKPKSRRTSRTVQVVRRNVEGQVMNVKLFVGATRNVSHSARPAVRFRHIGHETRGDATLVKGARVMQRDPERFGSVDKAYIKKR